MKVPGHVKNAFEPFKNHVQQANPEALFTQLEGASLSHLWAFSSLPEPTAFVCL